MHFHVRGPDHVVLTDRALPRWVLLAFAALLFAAVVGYGRDRGIDGFWPVVLVLGVLHAVAAALALLRWTRVEITADTVHVWRWRGSRGLSLPREALAAVELVDVPVAGVPKGARARGGRPLVVEVRLATSGDGLPATLPLWRSHRIARVCEFAGTLCAATGLPWRDARTQCAGPVSKALSTVTVTR